MSPTPPPQSPSKVPFTPAQADPRPALLLARAAEDSPLRHRLLSLFAEAIRDLRRSPESISAGLRAARDLPSPERRFASDAVHDLLRLRRRLAFLAGSESSIDILDAWLAEKRDPAHSEARLAAIEDPVERLAVSASYPDFLVTRLCAEYGIDSAAQLLAAMNSRAPLTVRVNSIKATRDQLAGALHDLGIATHPTPISALGLVLETRQNVYSMAPFRDGWMELQDEGSQLIAELVAPPPRGTVIDACAGAGGKTLAIAAALDNRGRVIAYDVGEKKLEELRKRVRRAGLTNVHAVATEGVPPDSARPAERVLCDVPCSGTGALRRNPEARFRLTDRDLAELKQKQRAILDSYASLVSPGGRLIYATCSILNEENAGITDSFLADNPAFEPVPAKEILGRERAERLGDGEALKLLPHVHGTDGFYARVLRRKK